MYDLIGDIHGYATELKQLLAKMDYREVDGVWTHSKRKVIFLGDFVDRGPEQVELMSVVKAMVENGTALTVMGNHEYNAVTWTMPRPDRPGEYLRPHNAKHRHQHREFLVQVGEGSTLHQSLIEWFMTLPVFLDLPELRVIHACWETGLVDAMRPFLDEHNRLRPECWVESACPDSVLHRAVDVLLKGPEIALPGGYESRDKDNIAHQQVRIQWWLEHGVSYRDIAIVREPAHFIPDLPAPQDVLSGYDNSKPVFIGHYWLTGKPKPLSPYVACLDYSVAARGGGKLAAYRFDGETTLDERKFVWVERRGKDS